MLQAAEYLDLADLGLYLRNIINKEQYLNKQQEESYLLVNSYNLLESRNNNSIYCAETLSKDNGIKFELTRITFKKLGNLLNEFCLSSGLFSDILFQLEDGTLPAHKPLLMAR